MRWRQLIYLNMQTRGFIQLLYSFLTFFPYTAGYDAERNTSLKKI